MKNYKTLILIAIGLTLFFCIAAQSDCKSKNIANKNQNMNANKPIETAPTPVSGEIRIIGEGAQSKAEQPFIFVARTPETYAELGNLVENLPPASQINFNNSAVVAAFAGTKNTGGYSVKIRKTNGKIAFGVAAPPQDAIVTQVITTPYEVAIIPAEKENDLPLDISVEWTKALENYKVTTGDFETSGGITGRGQNFTAEGTIGVLRSNDYVTLIFNLSGKDAESARKLNTIASGVIRNGKIELPRVDAGTFAQTPRPPLKVSGLVENDKLNLTFESLSPTASESFQIRGKVEAVKIK